MTKKIRNLIAASDGAVCLMAQAHIVSCKVGSVMTRNSQQYVYFNI